jgi:hypothetical protein
MSPATGMGFPAPPLMLDGARPIAYAIVDPTVIHVAAVSPIVNGKKLQSVSALAICQQELATILLMYCDSLWNVVAVVQCPTLTEAKARAEREYRGLSDKWKDAGVTAGAAARCRADQQAPYVCSFCGKSPDAVQKLYTATGVGICDICVRDLFGSMD